jgi:hypothetical protein
VTSRKKIIDHDDLDVVGVSTRSFGREYFVASSPSRIHEEIVEEFCMTSFL